MDGGNIGLVGMSDQNSRSPFGDRASLDKGRTTLPPSTIIPPLDAAEDAARTAKNSLDRDRARRRKLLRNQAGALLPGERVGKCGRQLSKSYEADAIHYAAIKRRSSGAFWSGVVTCGSLWGCQECAARISADRQDEVSRLVMQHQAAGGTAAMLTLTIGHNSFDACRVLRGDVSNMWSKVIAGAPWKRAKAKAGVVGFIRALEVTHGGNGWHPHLHILMFFEGGDKTKIAEFMEWIVDRWMARADVAERKCSRLAQQWDIATTPKEAGDYVTKWGASWELTHAHLKEAKPGGRSPFQILDDYR